MKRKNGRELGEAEQKQIDSYFIYLGYAAIVSLIVVIFIFGWYFACVAPKLPNITDLMFWISVVILVIFLAVGISCLCDLGTRGSSTQHGFAKIGNTLRNQGVVVTGRVTTALFFAYIAAIALMVIRTGGAMHSFAASLLLLNATFGFNFARSKWPKNLALWLPTIAYMVTIFLYVDPNTQKFAAIGFWNVVQPEALLYSGVALLVVLITHGVAKRQESTKATDSDDLIGVPSENRDTTSSDAT